MFVYIICLKRILLGTTKFVRHCPRGYVPNMAAINMKSFRPNAMPSNETGIKKQAMRDASVIHALVSNSYPSPLCAG